MRPETPDPENRVPGWLIGLGALQFIAVLIALVMPVTPGKTGSTWSPAELYKADPTYFDKVLAAYVVVNAMFVVLGVMVWIVSKFDRAE